MGVAAVVVVKREHLLTEALERTPLLAATGLSCTVAGRCLFHSLDITVEAGALIEVRGVNGSGKSTLLRGLAGLQRFQAGQVTRHAAIDYLGHKAGLSERLTPLENARWQLAQRGRAVDDRIVQQALAKVDLADASWELCTALSAGQLRRAALVRLIVGNAPLWLLDEPLTALDQEGVRLVWQLIAEHRARGGGVVCATHGSVQADGDCHPFRAITLA